MTAKQLHLCHEEVLQATAPFSFEGTMYKPSHFPAESEIYEAGNLWFSLRLDDEVYGIHLASSSRESSGIVPVAMRVFTTAGLSAEAIRRIRGEITFRFDLPCNLADFMRLAAADPVLGPIEAKWRGMRISCAYSLYELICITIVLQNAQVRRSVSMLQNLLATYGERIAFDGRELYAFWTPAQMAVPGEDELRGLKVGYRAKSFCRVARIFADDPELETRVRRLPKQEASRDLQRIYGIGPASSGYLLFEYLHHYDALDYLSPWETKILGMLLLNDIEAAAQDVLTYVYERWGAWRMLAAHYIFEDAFWRRQTESVPWLNELIRL
jgi:3-methyladenine DNA glycosylase/8-oxoguanine DNA glycosylase